MVGLFNGFGGGASVLVATAALFEAVTVGNLAGGAGAVGTGNLQFVIATVLSALIGAITFWGKPCCLRQNFQVLLQKKRFAIPANRW